MLTFLKELGIGLLCVGGAILLTPVFVAGWLVVSLVGLWVYDQFESPKQPKMVWTRALVPA